MKKLLIIGLIILLVAVGASVMTGRVFQKQLVNLEAEISKDPRFEAVSNNINTGLFSSSGSVTVAMYLADNQQLIIENPWQASHFPGWVNYQGQTLLTLEVDGQEAINLLEELNLSSLEYQGKADWKKATFSMFVEPFLFEDEYAKVEMSGIDLAGTYHYSGRQVGKLMTKNLALLEKGYETASLKFEELALSWDQVSNYPFVQGGAELMAGHIYFSSPQGKVELGNPSWSQELDFNEQNFDYLMSLDLGDIKSQGENIGTAKFSLKTANFNGQAVADLLALMAGNSAYEQMDAATTQAIVAAVDKLLGGSPALILNDFKLNVHTPFTFEQEATGRLSFDGSNLPINYLQQLDEGRLNSDDALSRTRLELNFNKIDPGLLMLVGIPPSMLNTASDEQKLVFEAGKLKLNGQPLPF